MTEAILLVGHGTRNETGQQQFLRLAEHLRAAVAPLPVEVAYIELQQPTIEEALVRMFERGLKKVTLSPALLFAAGHAKQDIPGAVAEARARCPGLQVSCAEPLGCHRAVIELAALRFLNSLAPVLRGEGRGEQPESKHDSTTALVLIGRGSSDAAAIAHCQEFARLLGNRVQVEKVFTGFIAMARPTLSEALEQAAQSGAEQIVVQPHLLFAGEMADTTAAAVHVAAERHPKIDWRIAETLGSDLLQSKSLAAESITRALLTRGGIATK